MATVPSRRKQRAPKTGWQRWLTTDRTLIGGTVVFTLLFFLFAALDSARRSAPAVDLAQVPDRSQTYEIQSRDHIEVGASHPPYNSNPPTGGWHYANPADIGFYTTQLPDEQLVHNLEHGQIWLSFRDADDTAAIDVLRAVQARQPGAVIVTHRPENPARIAVASWGQLLLLDEPDVDQMVAFITRYKNRAPEPLAM